MLGTDIAYMHSIFDHSSFSRFGYMVDAHRNLNVLPDLTTPLSGIVSIHGLAIATINLKKCQSDGQALKKCRPGLALNKCQSGLSQKVCHA